jgi:hypothetical protein
MGLFHSTRLPIEDNDERLSWELSRKRQTHISAIECLWGSRAFSFPSYTLGSLADLRGKLQKTRMVTDISSLHGQIPATPLVTSTVS